MLKLKGNLQTSKQYVYISLQMYRQCSTASTQCICTIV